MCDIDYWTGADSIVYNKNAWEESLGMSLKRRDYRGHSKVALGTVLECHQEGVGDYGIVCVHTDTHTYTILWSASKAERDPAVFLCPKSERPVWCNVCLCGVKYAHIKTFFFTLSLNLSDIIKKGPICNNSYTFQPDFKCYGVYGWKLVTALSYLAVFVHLFVKLSSHQAHRKTSSLTPELRGRRREIAVIVCTCNIWSETPQALNAWQALTTLESQSRKSTGFLNRTSTWIALLSA